MVEGLFNFSRKRRIRLLLSFGEEMFIFLEFKSLEMWEFLIVKIMMCM